MIKRMLSLVFLLALAVAGAARAEPAQAPDAALKGTVEQIRGMIRDHYSEYKADSGKFYKAVDEVVVPRFDVPYIAHLVLGANYRNATSDQRERFANAFKDMLVHSYASAMLENYNSVKITWLPVHMNPADPTDASVDSSLLRDNGQAYTIGFRVHQVAGDWKIYDINVEKISLVINFRTQLNAEIRKNGLDAVIARMVSGEFSRANAPQPSR